MYNHKNEAAQVCDLCSEWNKKELNSSTVQHFGADPYCLRNGAIVILQFSSAV